MTQNRYYSNIANVTTLSNTSGMLAASTSMSVVSTTGWPTSFPFTVRVEPDTANEELVLVTSGLGTLATPYVVTRGYDGTSAKDHANGVTVEHGFSQVDFQEPQLHLNLSGASSAAHGLPSSAWAGGTLQAIGSTTLAASGTITFSTISAGFSHLRLVVAGVSNATGGTGFDDIALQFNGDIASDYTWHSIYAVNSTTITQTSGVVTTAVHAGFVMNGGSNLTSSAGYGMSVIDIPLYSLGSVSKQITFSSHASSGVGAPNNFQVGTGGGIWGNNTAVINTIKIFPATSPNTFAAGSRAFLYGIL